MKKSIHHECYGVRDDIQINGDVMPTILFRCVLCPDYLRRVTLTGEIIIETGKKEGISHSGFYTDFNELFSDN